MLKSYASFIKVTAILCAVIVSLSAVILAVTSKSILPLLVLVPSIVFSCGLYFSYCELLRTVSRQQHSLSTMEKELKLLSQTMQAIHAATATPAATGETGSEASSAAPHGETP